MVCICGQPVHSHGFHKPEIGDLHFRLITSIEVRYLRSIHRLRIRQLGDLTVFSGANDVGKSNVLKALNLFFNNEVDWLASLDFYQDFSLRRLNEVRRESIKGKQFIRIDVVFARPSNYKGSLPTHNQGH